MGTSNENARGWWSGGEDEGVAGIWWMGVGRIEADGVQGCQCLSEEQGMGCDKGEY